ncbi:MAG: hypothetical protein JOZ02_12825 [Acidobacteria bacterium]|nr:hypothetical protein [Acidobacteriota bacterium]
MADKIVEDAVHSQLEIDVRARLQQAGEDWQTLDLGFYYGRTKSDEISIDLAIKAAMLQVLVKDHARLPDRVWTRLRKRINADTVVSDAIDTLSQARDAEEDAEEDD